MKVMTGCLTALCVAAALGIVAADVRAAEPVMAGFEDAVVKVVEKLEPSVVQVNTTTQIEIPTMEVPWPFGPGEMFPFGPGQPQTPHAKPHRGFQRGLGSGFVYTADGYIVTNNHVIENVDKVTVAVPGTDKEYEVVSMVSDPETDIALLKIEPATPLVPAELGDSDALRVGEWVVAIGSPFGLEQTVTVGVVSATGRRKVPVPSLNDFIQTDAQINVGNSGGPLADIHGRVIGINTFIWQDRGAWLGTPAGFAIPINAVKKVLPTLMKGEQPERGFLGVQVSDPTEADAATAGSPAGAGAIVRQLEPNSPAAGAGLELGDVITAVDGKAIGGSGALVDIVTSLSPGLKSKLEVYRDGKSMTLDVEIGKRPSRAAASAEGAGAAEGTVLELGVSVHALAAEDVERYDLPEDLGYGAVVDSVSDDSLAAAEIGLRVGDCIVRVGSAKVEDSDSLAKAMAEQVTVRDGKKYVRIVFYRGKVRGFASVVLPEEK